MKNNTLHIVGNEFSRGIGHSLEWWKYRLSIYENYTLRSLMNQTNKNFYILMTLDNKFPLREELTVILEKSGLKYIIFDKSSDHFEEVIQREAPPFDYVFATRLDSDDLFRNDAIDEIQQYDFIHQGALVHQKGYCYNCVDKKLQHYFVQSPPTSTIMYTKEIFLSDDRRREYTNSRGHDQVFSQMNSIVLTENMYMILIHEHNRRSVYLEGEQAKQLDRHTIVDSEHDSILKDFNISSLTYEKTWKE